MTPYEEAVARYREWVERGRQVGKRLRELGYPEKRTQYRAGYYPGKDAKK